MRRPGPSTISVLTALLALAVALWWVALYASVRFRGWFVPPPEWDAFQSLLLPDIGLALLTAAAAVVVRADRRPAGLFACVTGAWGYAMLYTLSWWSRAAAPVPGLVLMILATTLVIVCCHAVVATDSRRR
jgi:hypothetical protein